MNKQLIVAILLLVLIIVFWIGARLYIKATPVKKQSMEPVLQVVLILKTPEEIVHTIYANIDGFTKPKEGKFSFNLVDDNNKPFAVEIEGWIITKQNEICLQSNCIVQTNTPDVFLGVSKLLDSFEFESAPFNSGAGGFNFTDGRKKDDIVCIYKALADKPENSRFIQEVTFACGYLGEYE